MSDADSNVIECWRPIPGYEGIYAISTFGRVRRDCRSKGYGVGRILKPSTNGTGYLKATLCGRSGEHRQFLIHRLVMLAYVGPCPTGREVNHRNGIKTDNCLANLEYVTPQENQRHRFDVLGQSSPPVPEPRFGEAHPHSRLTDDQVRQIRAIYGNGDMTQKQVGAMFGIKQTHVGKIVRRVLWPHVD